MKRLLKLAVFLTFLSGFPSLGVAATASSEADMLETPYEIGGLKFKVAKTIKAGPESLSLTGYGIRKKKVVFIKVNVYVASHYVSNPSAWTANDPAGALKKQPRRLLNLNFMRDVPGEKIKGAFEDSLKENGLDPERKDLAKILNGMAADLKEKDQISFSGTIDGKSGEQTLTAKGPSGSVEAKSPSIVDDMWSIWFGKPADGGLEDLKAELSVLPVAK